MDIVGFVHIAKNAKTCKGAKHPEDFIGQICAVMEFDRDGGAMVFNPKGTALAMFEKTDFYRSFKCGYKDGIVLPPGLNFLEGLIYMHKCTCRKGGYNNIVCNMVIQASLMKGKFEDGFLWALQ